MKRLVLALMALLIPSSALAQSYNDGDMDIGVYVTWAWVESNDDIYPDNSEYTWKFWGADNADLDGAGWRGGQCLTWSSNGSGWFDVGDVQLFGQAYGAAVPQYLMLRAESWEDDRGDRCNYDGNGAWYENDDDQHCGALDVNYNIDYRQLAPAQTATTLDVYSGACGDNDIGARLAVYWTPPRPDNARANGSLSGATVCSGASVSLSSDGGAAFGGVYYWTTSGGDYVGTANPLTLTPGGSTTYRVYTRNGSVNSKSYREVGVTVNPPPAAEAGPDQSVCQGQSATLTASGGSSYVWSTGAVTSSITVTPSATTTYSVTVRDAAGCAATDTVTVTVTSPPTWYADRDADGYGDLSRTAVACSPPTGYVSNPLDCADDPAFCGASCHPDATEVCDGYDNDCDAEADDYDADLDSSTWNTWYRDGDGDGYGSATTAQSCAPPIGFVGLPGDCDDSSSTCGAACNPSAKEICDSFDNDCDAQVDSADPSVDSATFTTYYADRDGDSYGDPSSTTRTCPGPSGAAPTGYAARAGDCEDSPLSCGAGCNPTRAEICDSYDNDCDGAVDDGDGDIAASSPQSTGANTWYTDGDGDGCGLASSPRYSCASSPPAGAVADTSDVSDTDGQCCGNGRAEGTERCDGPDPGELPAMSCAALDPQQWASGELACRSDCGGFDTSACVGHTCGDGAVGPGEVCDDGDQDNTDACLSTCVAASCGDGAQHVGVEACDDGGSDNTDGCLASCELATCGDGFTQVGVEECDDGNDVETDGCVSTCERAFCGDGFVQDGVEACDPASPDGGPCTDLCAQPGCGDGEVQSPEACDDGNQQTNDACLPSCRAAFCGDGFVHDGVEECDDANLSSLDSCLPSCVEATCGDGHVQEGVEECDDANDDPDDGCDDCTISFGGTPFEPTQGEDTPGEGTEGEITPGEGTEGEGTEAEFSPGEFTPGEGTEGEITPGDETDPEEGSLTPGEPSEGTATQTPTEAPTEGGTEPEETPAPTDVLPTDGEGSPTAGEGTQSPSGQWTPPSEEPSPEGPGATGEGCQCNSDAGAPAGWALILALVTARARRRRWAPPAPRS